MIDNYAWFGIAVRVITLFVLAAVAVKQYQQFSYKSEVQGLKTLLLTTTSLMILASLLSIIVNLFRGDDGNLLETARHIYTVVNSLADLSVAVVLYLIYRFRAEEPQ